MRKMLMSAVGSAALAMLTANGAGATSYIITDVETGNGNLGNVQVPGYGSPWTTPILFTDNMGQTFVVFCDDLNHDVNVGGGQHLPYMTALVKYDGLGNMLLESQSNVMGQLADIGKYDYAKSNEDGAIAAQAAIWDVEYGVAVTSSDPTIQADLTYLLGHVHDNGLGWASGIVPADGSNTQAQITGGVPEPSTWAMMLLGFAGLGYAARRKAKRSLSIA